MKNWKGKNMRAKVVDTGVEGNMGDDPVAEPFNGAPYIILTDIATPDVQVGDMVKTVVYEQNDQTLFGHKGEKLTRSEQFQEKTQETPDGRPEAPEPRQPKTRSQATQAEYPHLQEVGIGDGLHIALSKLIDEGIITKDDVKESKGRYNTIHKSGVLKMVEELRN